MKIAVLTVFFEDNVENFLTRYLASVNQVALADTKFYLMDNSSEPRLKSYIKSNKIKVDKDKVTILEKHVNGFSPANEYLARFVKRILEFKYFIFLNPDTEFTNDSIKKLVEFSKNKKNLFAVDGRQYPFEHPKDYDHISNETSWCSGACMLVDVNRYFKVGGFDKSFFMYCEDVDLSWKGWASGWKCYYCPEAVFVHHCFGAEKSGLLRQYWGIRNGVIMRFRYGTLTDVYKYFKIMGHLFIRSSFRFNIVESWNIFSAFIGGFFFGLLDLHKFNSKSDSYGKFYGVEYARMM